MCACGETWQGGGGVGTKLSQGKVMLTHVHTHTYMGRVYTQAETWAVQGAPLLAAGTLRTLWNITPFSPSCLPLPHPPKHSTPCFSPAPLPPTVLHLPTRPPPHHPHTHLNSRLTASTTTSTALCPHTPGLAERENSRSKYRWQGRSWVMTCWCVFGGGGRGSV